MLRDLALAEQAARNQNVAAVNGALVAAVHGKMLELYAPVAKDIYRKAADMFDEAAASFTACCSVVDAETVATVMVGREEPERVAWQSAEQHAARLSLLLPVVATAASLAGIDIDPNVPNDSILLPLVVDTTGLHRRRLWECWVTKDGDGRTGRWGALVALGATIRAANLDSFERYAEPRPIERRQQEFAKGQYRTIEVDPEDNPGALPPIDPKRPQGAG